MLVVTKACLAAELNESISLLVTRLTKDLIAGRRPTELN